MIKEIFPGTHDTSFTPFCFCICRCSCAPVEDRIFNRMDDKFVDSECELI